MSVSSQRRIRLSAWSSVQGCVFVPEYSLIIAVLVSLIFPISAEYSSYTCQKLCRFAIRERQFAAMSCFLIEAYIPA